MAIYKKLLNIQKAVKGLKKDSKSGTGSFSYQYLSGDKLLGHIREHMDAEGVLLKMEVVSTKNTPYTKKGTKFDKNGNSYETEKTEIFTELELRFTWIDAEDGSTDVNMFSANGMNDMEKGLGSALTYGERYFFMKYFHIQTDCDDVDNPERRDEVKDEAHGPLPQKKTTDTVPPAEAQTSTKDISFVEKLIGEETAKKFREVLITKFGNVKAQQIVFAIEKKYQLKDLMYLKKSTLQKLKEAQYDVEKVS